MMPVIKLVLDQAMDVPTAPTLLHTETAQYPDGRLMPLKTVCYDASSQDRIDKNIELIKTYKHDIQTAYYIDENGRGLVINN